MSYSKATYTDVDAVGGGLHLLRDILDCDQLGFSVVDADPNWTGKEHDHAEGGHEEVYFLVEGEATIHIDGDEVAMDPGDAVRVAPEASRQIENGPLASQFVVVGAP